MKNATFYLQFGLILVIVICAFAQPEVNTNFGPVRGVLLRTARGAEVAGFLGLPYAEPPVGNLRFENPVLWTKKWSEVRNVTADASMCMQKGDGDDVIGDEDCLYLNVFTPMLSQNETETQKKNLSVMVFVHGGGFNQGSSNSTLFAPTYLLDHGIVLVTLNYRLNVLGFFSTGNDVTPGNYGLKDIVAALTWVQNNIAAFGGDPNSVTLAGHSSGAASAQLLSASEATEGLFHKLITMSGSAIASTSFHSRVEIRNSSMDVARHLGCDGQDKITAIDDPGSGDGETDANSTVIEEEEMLQEIDVKIMDCMKKADPVDIVNWGYYYVWRRNPVCIFGPTLEAAGTEGAVVTAHPQRSLSEGLFRDMPWITGVTADEGLGKTTDFFLVSQIRDDLLQDYEQLLPYVLEMGHAFDNTTAVVKAIEDFYFDGDIATNFERNITQLVGDGIVAYSSYEILQKQVEKIKSDVYFYLFSYEGTFSNSFRSGIPFRFGASHGDDLNYIFPILNEKYADLQLFNTMADRTIINIMTEMFVNFVKTGVPSARLTSSWERYQEHRRFMKFGDGYSSDRTMEADFLPERMAFWSQLWSNYSTPIDEFVVEKEDDEEGVSAGARNTGGIDYALCVYATLVMVWTRHLYM